MEEDSTPDLQDSVLLGTDQKNSLIDGKAESNPGVRKSSRPRKQSKRSLDSAECEDDELVGIPLHKKHRKGLKVRTHRRKDILQNGRPFKCSLCQSQYINNCPAKAKIKREVQPIVKEKFGQLLQLCVKCAIAVNHTENKGPSPEQRAEFEEEGKQFAQHLVKYLGDSAAARLYCSFYQTTRCGCIQCYITGTQANRRRKTSVSGAEVETSDTVELKGEDGVASTDDKADQTERAKYLLGLLKESMAKKQAQNTKASNDKSQQTRNDSASVMKESEKFILENRMKLKELGICERGCQKVLCYSNNFLHKKSFGSQPRLQRTKGRAALGRLHALDDLCKMRCCEKNCVKLAGKVQAKLADWRQRAQGGQKEMWKVLEEMLTFTDSGKTSCYKFICMVTGCCLTTVQKVYAEILLFRGTTGCPSQKEHGMIFHWKRQKEQGKLLKVQAMATVQDQTMRTDPQMHTSAAVCDPSFVPTLVADKTASSAHVPDVKKEQKAPVVMMAHMAVSSQAETESQFAERVAGGREDKQDIKEKFLQLFENIKDPQEITNMQIILAELQRNLIVKQEKEHAQQKISDVYTPSSGSAATTEPLASSVCFPTSTPLAFVPAMLQTPDSACGAASKGFPQIVLQESHLASVSISKTGRPFVHIKVPQTFPEQKTSIHQILQVDSKEQAATTAASTTLHMLHTVANSTHSAEDSQVVDDLYSVQADTSSSQHLTQRNLTSRLIAEPGRFSAQPRTSTPAISGSCSRSSTAKTSNVTVSSENSFNQLSQQVGLFQVVTPSQTEASKTPSQSSQMLPVYPQPASLQIQPLSLPPSTNAQNIQFKLVSPLILGQPNMMIQPGTMSFILQKPATAVSQGSQSFLQAPTLTSSSSISHKDFVISHVSPMQNFPASAPALSDSCQILRNKCLSTFPSQTECNLTFSNNTCNIQYSKSENSSASSNAGVKEEATIQNLGTHLDNFSESAEPHNDIVSKYPTNRNSMAQDDSCSSQSTTAAVVQFQGGIQACGQEGKLLHHASSIEQYFPSLLNQAAGDCLLATASACSLNSFIFDALAESPVKDSSLPLSSPSLHPVPIVTSSLLCEMLMSSALPSIVSLATPTTSQTPVYTVNSHSSRSLKPSLLASLKPSPSASAYCQSINFSTHTTPSSLSTQPVVMASKVEQTSLPIAVTIGHNASLSHSQISVSRLNRQRDPPQVGIVHPHVSGGKVSLGEAVNSHACSSTSSLSQNCVYSSSVASAVAANVPSESQSSTSSSGLMSANNSNVQVSTSVQELSADILSNQSRPQQQQLLLSLLLNPQNASLPNKTLINIPQSSQFNLSALLGNPGNSVANTTTASDSHKRQTSSSSQNDINVYDFHVNSQNIPNPSLQNTMIDNGNFLQSQTPLAMGSLMPVSIGNQHIVSGTAGTQLPICDPHMLYSNTGHVKLVPIILSDGSHGGSPSGFFAQNGQLILNMSPCAGIGNVSSFSPQSLNRDSSFLLNLSPSSGQNMQLQHHPLLQVEDMAQTTSALPLASPSSQNIHHGRETGVFSKDQTQTVQVSVLPFATQHADNQRLAQIELQRDSALSQSMSSKEPLYTKNVENKMSFYTLPGLLRPAMETAPAQKSHSDLSCSQSILSSTDAGQNGQDEQSSENPSSGQNVLISCNVVQVSRSSETPHKITEAAGTISASLPTSSLTETKSSFASTAMSEQHNPCVDSVRESRNRSQVYLYNQTRNDHEDQHSQLQSTRHSSQQLQSTQLAAQQLQSTQLAAQQLQSTQLATQQLQSTQHATQQLQSTQLAAQQLQSTQHSTQQLQSTQHAAQQLQSTQHATQQLQSTQHAAQQLQSTQHAAQQLQSTQHATQQLQPTQHAAQQLQSTQHATQQLQSTQHAAQQLQSTQHATQQLQPTQHAAQQLQSIQHAAQQLQPTQHAAQQLQSIQHAAQQLQPTQHAAHHLQPTQLSQQQLQSIQLEAQQLQSIQLEAQQHQLPLQVVNLVQTPAEQTNSDRLMASSVGTSFVLGQPTFQNYGLGQQLHSLLSMSNSNQIFLPIQSVPFSSHSAAGDNISQTNQELQLGQQLSELYKPGTIKSAEASSSVPASQASKNMNTHIPCTSLQSAVASSGSQLTNSVASAVGSSKHRPIRPKLRPIPPAPASKISLMLVPDKPGYPAYQLTQVDSATLPFQQASEQSNQSPLVSQQSQNVLLNTGASLQKQNSIAGASKQQGVTRPLVNTAFVTQLQLNQQSNVPAQILLLSQSELTQRIQNAETQAIIGHQNEILTLPSEQMNTSIHALSLGGKRDRTVSQSKDIPEIISQQIVSIQPGHFQMTSDCDTSGLPFLQNETMKFSSADCESFELKPFENKEYQAGIFSNESVFVNTSQGTFSAGALRSDTFEVNSLQNSGFDPGSQQTHSVQFGCLEANAPGCSTTQDAVSQFSSLSVESSQLIPVQQLAQTDIQRLNPQIASQLSSGDMQRLNAQIVTQLSSADTQRLTPQIVSQLSSADTQRMTPQIVTQLSSGDTQRLNAQIVSQLNSADTQRLTPQIASQLNSADTQRLTPQIASQLNSGGTQRSNAQIASQLSSGDTQRLAHNLVHVSTADGLGDLFITTYKGSQILQISQPESHHHIVSHPDVTRDTSSSSGLGPHTFTHSEHSPADITAQAAGNNRSQAALNVRHVTSSSFNTVQKHEVKTSGGSCFSTAMISNLPVTSSELPVYTQYPQKGMHQPALMLDSKISKGEDTKPALDPIQYLQCKDVIDLTEEDSPSLSPNSISMNKGKTVGLVSIHSNQAQMYENLQKQIFSDHHISGQQHTVSVPFQDENLMQQNQTREGLQWGQLKQESKGMHGVLHDHVLTEGSDFNLSSGGKKELSTSVLKLEEIPEDIRQVLLASLEYHAAGNPDVHLVTKAFTPSDDLSYHSFMSFRDQIHSVTDLADKNSYPSNVMMMSSNQHIEHTPARTQSQLPQPVAVSDSKLGAMIHTQPENKKVSQTRRSGSGNPSPGLNSLSATKLTGQLKQEMGLAYTLHELPVSTSSLSLDATAIPSSSQTSSYVVSPGSHKLAGTTSCPPLLLTTLNTVLPRSPNVKAPLHRTVIHPLTSSTVAFIRANNTPTEAVGPPNITIMSSTQASTSPHLRLRHENSVSMTAASSSPLIISNISTKPVSTMAKNHSSRLLKINSIPPISAPAREQGMWDIKLAELSCAASEGKDKAASQSGRRLSFENQKCQKEAPAIETSSTSLSVGSLLNPPEAVTPCRPKGRKKPSTIMDLLKNKERLQATASSSFSVNSTTGPVTFMIPGNPDLLLMDSSATRAGINSGTMNIAVKNLQLREKLTSSDDTNCTAKQISSSSFTVLHPSMLPSISGSCNIVATSTHITAVTATEQAHSTAAPPSPSVSQSHTQVSVSMTASRPQMTSPAEKSVSAAPSVSSFTGSMSQPNILSGALAQSATLSSQFSTNFYRSRNAATEVSGEGYAASRASANSSGATVQDPDFKHTHLQEVAKSDTHVQFQPVGQPQVASGSFSLKDLTQKPHAESFNGEKLKFKTTAIRNTSSGDRQQELISNKFQLLEDTWANLPSHSTGTIKKLLLLKEKPGSYNSKLLSDSLLRSSIHISDNSQQDCTNENPIPQKSAQLLQLMKSKQSVSYTDFNPAFNVKLAHSSGHDKCAPLKLPHSSASVAVSGDNLVYDYSASAHLSYNYSKEDFRQKDQLHVFKTESSVPVLQQKESKMGLLEASGNITAMDASPDSRMNLLPSQHPLLATILFTGDSNTPLQPLPSESANKSPVHFENQPKCSGKKRSYTEGNSYSNNHTVLGHQTLPSPLAHPHGSKVGKHIQLSSEAENTVSGLSNLATRAPPAYNYPPRYEIPKKDMTRVNRVIEDIYKFPDEGEEPSPPPVFGGLKSHKFTYTHRSHERAAGLSSASLAQSSENSQFLAASNKKSSPKTVQNTSGNSVSASPGKSYASGNPQTWRSPKKLKAKRDQERSNCKINLKKVQFSDVVTSKSAPEYGQSTTVNPSVDALPAEPASNQRDKTKCPVQEYAVEDSRKLLGKHERLEKDRQDNHTVYEKQPYTADQLQTEFPDGKVRAYHPGLTEASFTRPENLQVNIKNKASKTLGVNTTQRDTDSISDFETERQFGREMHKGFQHQHLASVSHTAAAADSEQKFKHRGDKDTDPFQTIRQAHDNPCTFQSGFGQESLDTMYSFVHERSETGRGHNVQNALKPCEQTIMSGTFEGMSSQCGDMIHNKVEESSRDLTKRRHVVQDDNLQFSADPEHKVHSFERNNYVTDKKEFDLPPTNVTTTNCDRDSTFDQQSSFNILSTQGYSKLSRQRLHRTDLNHIWTEYLTPAPFKPHAIRMDETGVDTSDNYENREFSYQIRCEPVPVGSEATTNVERQPSESPPSRQEILQSNFEIARQMKKGHVRILTDSRSDTSEGRKMESPQKFFLHPERSEDVSSTQMQRDTECQVNKDLEYRTLSGAASKLTSPIFSNNMDGRPDLLTSLESLSCLRKEIKDLKGENHYLKLEVARAEQKGKEQQRQRKLSTTDKQRAMSTEIEKTEKSYHNSTSLSSQSHMADTDTVTPIRKRHTSSTAALGALNYSLFPSSEQLKLEDSFQSKMCQLSSGSSGIQQMFDPDMPFPDSNNRGSAAEAVYTRSSINIDDSPEHYIRDSRDPLVSSSMSSHSRPTSQLDLSMVQYDPPRHKYPFSEVKTGPLRSISDGDGFVPLQEHTRHRNLSSSLGFHVLSDVDPPSYEITQRQRNPSASSLKSAFQDADILNFDMGARSRNPSSSSWIRYLDYGTDFTIIRSRNPSGSSNRRSRPGSSSSSEREHPVNVDELPLFSDIAHTRSRNSSGESIEPTLDHIIDPQQFMQYTQYTYQSGEAHSKRTKH